MAEAIARERYSRDVSFHGLGQKRKTSPNFAMAKLKVHHLKAMHVSAISNDVITRTIAVERGQGSNRDEGGAEVLYSLKAETGAYELSCRVCIAFNPKVVFASRWL
jgi:hypothetical protein